MCLKYIAFKVQLHVKFMLSCIDICLQILFSPLNQELYSGLEAFSFYFLLCMSGNKENTELLIPINKDAIT